MAVCQRVDERRHDHQHFEHHFLVCIGIAAIYCAANALILWWRQPGKDDEDDNDNADESAESDESTKSDGTTASGDTTSK